ncbi:MAG: holo-ACP synthase [Deltaproteobacteria bacterium]
MVYGIGIEIVDVDRFARALLRWGDRLKHRLFTGPELAYCLARRFPERHLSARFAGKMSVKKALGKNITFKDIEIKRDGDGRPSIEVKGLKGFEFSISITHDGNLSLAETIAQRIE